MYDYPIIMQFSEQELSKITPIIRKISEYTPNPTEAYSLMKIIMLTIDCSLNRLPTISADSFT